MSVPENKSLVRSLAKAENLDALLGLMADDVRYTVIGNTRFSGTFNGKQELVNKLIIPLVSMMESMGTNVTDNLIAEGDYVVVQSRAEGRRTKAGKDYNNTYCLVYRIADGKVNEVTEYCDTELVTAAFGR